MAPLTRESSTAHDRRVTAGRRKEESADSQPTVTARYAFPFLAHATMEPMTTTVEFTGGKAQVWAPSQTSPRCARGG